MKKAFVFRKLSPELEEVLIEDLHTLKGGTGGNSDNWLDEVVIIGEPPKQEEEEEEEEEEPEDPEGPDPWDDPGGWWWGGGTDPGDQPDPEEEETPCDKAKAAGDQAKNILNSDGVQQAINQSLGLPAALGQEAFFSINVDSNGNITSTIPHIGDSWNVNASNGVNAIADFHTHANSNYPPGGADIITFLRDRLNGSPNLETSFIRTQDGTTYAMVVTDESLIEDFYADHSGSVLNGGWDSNTSIGGLFNDAETYFKGQGMSDTDAYGRATAYVMERAGLTLLEAGPTQVPNLPESFNKVGVSSSLDQNGNLQYHTDDCP